MGLMEEKIDEVKEIVINNGELRITMGNKSTYVINRDDNVKHHQAWIMNIIACACSLVDEVRDEQDAQMERMSQLYADEDHYEWASELNNRGDEDWVDGEERDNNSSDGDIQYGDYDDDEYDY